MSIFIKFTLKFSDEVTRLKISDEVTLFIGRGDFLIWGKVTDISIPKILRIKDITPPIYAT